MYIICVHIIFLIFCYIIMGGIETTVSTVAHNLEHTIVQYAIYGCQPMKTHIIASNVGFVVSVEERTLPTVMIAVCA